MTYTTSWSARRSGWSAAMSAKMRPWRSGQRSARLRMFSVATCRRSTGGSIAHGTGHRLEATFVTPFDREEIHSLISGLDDVLDLIEETADTFVLYRIDAPTAAAIESATIVVRQCELLHEALSHLRGFKGLDRYW